MSTADSLFVPKSVTVSRAAVAVYSTIPLRRCPPANHHCESFSNDADEYANAYFFRSALFSLTLGLVCCVVSDTSTQTHILFTNARLLTTAIAAASALLPRLCGMQTLLTLLISARGLDALDGNDSYATASIWITPLGAITPSAVVLCLLAIHILRHRLTTPPRAVGIATVAFLAIPAITALGFGGYSDAAAFSYLKTDVRLAALLCGALYLTHIVLEQHPQAHPVLSGTVLGAVASRHLMDFFSSFSVEGISFGHGNIVSVCPAKTLVAVPLLFALLLVVYKRYVILSMIVATFSAYLTTAYNSRGLYITSILSVCYLLVHLPSFRKLKILGLSAALGAAGIAALVYVRPDTAYSAYCRISTLLLDTKTGGSAISPSSSFEAVDPVRHAEFKNILTQGLQNWSFVFGQGFGASYTDSAATIPIESISAFPLEQILVGRFFYAHDLPSHFILKYGVFGLSSYLTLWLIALPPRRLMHVALISRQAGRADLYAGGVLTLASFTPTAVHSLWWSGKGIFIAGVLLSLLTAYRRRLICNSHEAMLRTKWPIPPSVQLQIGKHSRETKSDTGQNNCS